MNVRSYIHININTHYMYVNTPYIWPHGHIFLVLLRVISSMKFLFAPLSCDAMLSSSVNTFRILVYYGVERQPPWIDYIVCTVYVQHRYNITCEISLRYLLYVYFKCACGMKRYIRHSGTQTNIIERNFEGMLNSILCSMERLSY